jgi:ferric-dicitrate binding protein FerR (iron transport regulator)
MIPDPLDILIEKLLDGQLSEAERAEFNSLLRESESARRQYRSAISLHGALLRRQDATQAVFAFGETTEEAPAGRKIITFPRVLLASAAACAMLGAFLHFLPQPSAKLVSGDFTTPAGANDLSLGKIPSGKNLEIDSGSLSLVFPSGAEVLLEAPCRFQLDRREALNVSYGRASVYAPAGAEGFQLDTPGGKFIDLGTRFGVAVGTDGKKSVVLTEVFEGEIDVKAPSQRTLRLRHGDSRAILRDGISTELVSTLDSSPIHLSRAAASAPDGEENLALGKPVFSPGYCVRPHGSVFPPDNLTDGRLNDSGVPGDWGFWLAPDNESGEFTVDLLQEEPISRVSLQNTCNRFINDRGTKEFAILVSKNNRDFTPAVDGVLPRIDTAKPGESFPFHDFTFPETTARYVKFVILSHYRHPSFPKHRVHSGGLNEIRIFR